MDFKGLPPLPLCVDLDGTLIKGDCSLRGVFKLLKRFSLWSLVKVLLLNLKGKSLAKHYLGQKAEFDPSELKYNKSLLKWLYQHQEKTSLYLVTGAPQRYADSISDYLASQGVFFKEVFGSSPSINLVSEQKAILLTKKFGHQQFIYIGNSSQDQKVWKHSSCILAVNPKPRVRSWIQAQKESFLIQKVIWSGEKNSH